MQELPSQQDLVHHNYINLWAVSEDCFPSVLLEVWHIWSSRQDQRMLFGRPNGPVIKQKTFCCWDYEFPPFLFLVVKHILNIVLYLQHLNTSVFKRWRKEEQTESVLVICWYSASRWAQSPADQRQLQKAEQEQTRMEQHLPLEKALYSLSPSITLRSLLPFNF